MLAFNKKYFLLAAILLFTEIFIALFMQDQFIRPYAGDFLVVILIYCFIKSFFNLPVSTVALFTLLFAYLIETLQYFHIADKLGLQHNPVASTVIGTSFEWKDIVSYTVGIGVVWLFEKFYSK